MRLSQCETALGLLVLAALVSVDSRALSKSSDGSKWKRAISISNSAGSGGTAPNSSSSQKPSSANATSDQISAKKVRLSDLTGERGGDDGDPSRSISIVTQTLLTFVTVFFLGCAIVLAIFAWKRFSDSPFR